MGRCCHEDRIIAIIQHLEGAGAVAKLAWLVERWWQDENRPARPPLLLLLAVGAPRWLRRNPLELPPWGIPGIWYASRPLLGDLVAVDLRGLPEDMPGASVLRLMPTPRTPDEERAAINRLLEDPAVLQSTKRKLLEGLMSLTIPSKRSENMSIVDRLLLEGLEKGRQEGRQEVLLELVRRRFGDEKADALSSIEDPDELERQVFALLDK